MTDLIDKTISDIKILPSLDKLGMINSVTVEVNPQRQVGSKDGTSDDFWRKGLIDTQFNISGNKRWVPKKSYFKATAVLTVNGLQPTANDNIVFAESFMCNIIASCSFYIGNTCVSRCDDYVGQTMMTHFRTMKDLNWLRTIGKDCYFLTPDIRERVNMTSSNGGLEIKTYSEIGLDDLHEVNITGTTATFQQGASAIALPDLSTIFQPGDVLAYIPNTPAGSRSANVVASATATVVTLIGSVNPATAFPTMTIVQLTRGRDTQTSPTNTNKRNTVQIIFQLPLGIFTCNSVLPQGEFRFKITPKNDKVGAVQARATQLGGGLPTGWDVNIKDFKLVNTVFSDHTSFDDDDYYLVLNEWELQNKRLNGGSSLTSHNFIVPPTTTKIVIFAQDTGSGSIDVPTVPPSIFKAEGFINSFDLRHIQLTYAGQTKPQNLVESKFIDQTSNLAQRYYWNAENCGLAELGGETFEDYLDRGIIYATEFVKPPGDCSTQLQIQLDFGNLTGEVELFIACYYRNVAKVSVSDGLITKVMLQEG